jgi:hypothetical protein
LTHFSVFQPVLCISDPLLYTSDPFLQTSDTSFAFPTSMFPPRFRPRLISPRFLSTPLCVGLRYP